MDLPLVLMWECAFSGWDFRVEPIGSPKPVQGLRVEIAQVQVTWYGGPPKELKGLEAFINDSEGSTDS